MKLTIIFGIRPFRESPIWSYITTYFTPGLLLWPCCPQCGPPPTQLGSSWCTPWASWVVVSTPETKEILGAQTIIISILSLVEGGKWSYYIRVNMYKYVTLQYSTEESKRSMPVLYKHVYTINLVIYHCCINHHYSTIILVLVETTQHRLCFVPAALVKVFIAGFSPWRRWDHLVVFPRWSRILNVELLGSSSEVWYRRT